MKEISGDELNAIIKLIDKLVFTYEYWNSYTQLPIEIEELTIHCETKKITGKYSCKNFGPGGNWSTPTETKDEWELKIIAENNSELKLEVVNKDYPKIIFLNPAKKELNFSSPNFSES